MFKTAAEMRCEERENMRGGMGIVKIQHIMEPEELKGKARLIGRITLEPQCSVGLHAHDKEEELYYLLQGKGKVMDNGVERILQAGDAVLTGDGNSHSIENIGEETLELLAVILTYS